MNQIRTLNRWAAASLAAAGLLAGCATPRKPAPAAPIVYPAPPAAPRLVYLTHITRPADVEKPPSAMMSFLVGAPPPKPGIGKPYGVALKDGRLYVCDSAAQAVHIVDLKARTWEYFRGVPGPGFRKPIQIALDDENNLYVTDTGLDQVLVFDAQRQYRTAIASTNAFRPMGVAVRGDRVYVTDLESKCVRLYDRKTLAETGRIPAPDADRAQGLTGPINLAFDGGGRLFVSDTMGFRVQVFDPEGKYVRTIGHHGDTWGAFAMNKGIALDRSNRVYVVDAAFQNVQIFDDQGGLLTFFGEPQAGVAGAMQLPAGVCISYDDVDLFRRFAPPGFDLEYVVLVANQVGGQAVNVYGFLRRPPPDGTGM